MAFKFSPTLLGSVTFPMIVVLASIVTLFIFTGNSAGAVGAANTFAESTGSNAPLSIASRVDVEPPAESAYCSCIIGIFEDDDTHDWSLVWTDAALPTDGPVRLKVAAATVNTKETGSIVVGITDDSGPQSIEVVHSTTTDDVVDWLELDVTPGVSYPFTVTHTGTARHYNLGSDSEALAMGQQEIRYLEGVPQEWGVKAAASETVEVEVTTDSSDGGANQATSITVTFVEKGTGVVVFGPVTQPLTLDATEVFSFVNGPTDQDYGVQLEADGHFRMRKNGGDENFYVLLCPDPEPPPPTCTLDLVAWYADGTLTLDVTAGINVPAKWSLWIAIQDRLIQIRSMPTPGIDPAMTKTLAFPGFPNMGTIGFLSTLVTLDGIICSDWETVNTGPGLVDDASIDALESLLKS